MTRVERFELTAIFEPVEEGWVQATIAEIPGVITAGRSMDEAKALLPDALREYLLALGASQPEPEEGPAAERVPLSVRVDV